MPRTGGEVPWTGKRGTGWQQSCRRGEGGLEGVKFQGPASDRTPAKRRILPLPPPRGLVAGGGS
jgi:hypothetical protein